MAPSLFFSFKDLICIFHSLVWFFFCSVVFSILRNISHFSPTWMSSFCHIITKKKFYTYDECLYGELDVSIRPRPLPPLLPRMLIISRDSLLYPVGPVGCAPQVSNAKKSSTCSDGGREVFGGLDRKRSPRDWVGRGKPLPLDMYSFFSGRPVIGSTSTRRVRKHGAVVARSRFDCGDADKCKSRLQSFDRFVSGGKHDLIISRKSHGTFSNVDDVSTDSSKRFDVKWVYQYCVVSCSGKSLGLNSLGIILKIERIEYCTTMLSLCGNGGSAAGESTCIISFVDTFDKMAAPESKMLNSFFKLYVISPKCNFTSSERSDFVWSFCTFSSNVNNGCWISVVWSESVAMRLNCKSFARSASLQTDTRSLFTTSDRTKDNKNCKNDNNISRAIWSPSVNCVSVRNFANSWSLRLSNNSFSWCAVQLKWEKKKRKTVDE